MRLTQYGGLYRVEYTAPPVPESPVPGEGDAVIELAEQQGEPTVILTYENGMTVYLHREAHDWGACERYAEAIQQWLRLEPKESFLGLPPSSMPQELIWLPRRTFETCLNIHDNVSQSPLALEKTGRRKRIIVPMGDGRVELRSHGPGKRR